MNELTQEEFDCSASDKADLEIIQRYLEVGDDESFFNRAAAAYPRTGASDPDKFLGDVEDLHLHSVGAASRHRNKLLLRMNQQTLQELAARVLDHELLFKYVFISGRKDSLKSIEQDPVSGPVLAMIRKRGLLPKPKDLAIEEKLEAASELAYPKLPCDLEKALKWATGEPDIRFEILERAFIDWTTTVAETPRVRESTLKRHRSSFKPGARHHPKIADQTKKIATKYLLLIDSNEKFFSQGLDVEVKFDPSSSEQSISPPTPESPTPKKKGKQPRGHTLRRWFLNQELQSWETK
jgi:hypothetical protein